MLYWIAKKQLHGDKSIFWYLLMSDIYFLNVASNEKVASTFNFKQYNRDKYMPIKEGKKKGKAFLCDVSLYCFKKYGWYDYGYRLKFFIVHGQISTNFYSFFVFVSVSLFFFFNDWAWGIYLSFSWFIKFFRDCYLSLVEIYLLTLIAVIWDPHLNLKGQYWIDCSNIKLDSWL